MMEILKAKNIHFYSFTPKELKQVSMIIRGLFGRVDSNILKQELD